MNFVRIYVILTVEVKMKFDVILHKENNGYWAEVPALKGCYTQGETIEEIKNNALRTANELFTPDKYIERFNDFLNKCK